MKRYILTALIIVSWIPSDILCQPKQILTELINIKYLPQDYVFSYDFQYSSGPAGLNEPVIGRGYIKYVPNDTLKFYFNLSYNSINNYLNSIYDGKNLEIVDHGKIECISINLDSFKFGYNYITGNIVSSLLPKFFFDSVFINEIINSDDSLNYSITEEFIFGKQCIKIRVKFGNNEELQNIVSNYYFDFHDKLCIGYRDSFDLAGTTMTQSLLIFNITKSTDLDERIFTADVYKDLGYTFKYPQKKVTGEQNNVVTKGNDLSKHPESKAFDFEKYKGKFLVLDFWYIGCAPCLKLIPSMEKLHQEFPNVSFIGMNVNDKPDKIKKFVEKRGIKYPVFPDESGLSKKYDMKGYPVVLIFDKSGNLIKRFDGYSDVIYDEMKSVIEEEIKK